MCGHIAAVDGPTTFVNSTGLHVLEAFHALSIYLGLQMQGVGEKKTCGLGSSSNWDHRRRLTELKNIEHEHQLEALRTIKRLFPSMMNMEKLAFQAREFFLFSENNKQQQPTADFDLYP